MKKKKSDEPVPADFKNNPFKSLKGIVSKAAPAAKKKAAAFERGANRNKPEDDASLFLRAVDGVTRIGRTRDSSRAQAGKAAAEKPDLASKDERLFLQAMQKIGTTFRDKAPEPDDEGSDRRSPTSRMRQLKRGTIRIAQELDLHGLLRDEALMRLGAFVVDAFNRGQKAVLVITGKGINSPGGPVLQGAVAEWLRTKGKGMVAEFSPAPRDRGGSGAFVVFLKVK